MIIKMGVDLKLEEFSDWVTKPGRTRVPYKDWRVLASWQKNETEVEIKLSPMSQDILLMRNMLTGEKLDFCIFAKEGFGRWVYNKLYNIKSKASTKLKIATMGIDFTYKEYDAFKRECFEKDLKLAYLDNDAVDIIKSWENLKLSVEIRLTDNLITLKNRKDSTEKQTLVFNKDKTYYGAYLYNKFFKEMEEKGEDNMKILNKSKFNFGTCENDNVRMSLYGLAVKNAEGTWVSYDPKTDAIMDADILNFDGRKFLFKMPVALKDIAVGDIILHNGIPMFVKNVGEDSRIVAIDPLAGEEKIVMLTKNCFGFDFATKIVSLFKLGDNVATPDAPFGNMLPFLLMGEDKDDIDPITMCMMMNQGGDFMSNPMMAYFLLMKDSDKKDMFPFLFMMNANK